MGAYMAASQSRFNGFYSDMQVEISSALAERRRTPRSSSHLKLVKSDHVVEGRTQDGYLLRLRKCLAFYPYPDPRSPECPVTKNTFAFKKRIVMIGFGSIGEGTLPLILRHLDVKPHQITIITADERGHKEAKEYGIEFLSPR